MEPPQITYDEVSDTLYVSFAPGENATGIELNDHVLLRINKRERKAIGVTFFDYSLLTQSTEVGPRSYPLTGLAELSQELRRLVIEIISRPPVSQFLVISAYALAGPELRSFSSLHPALSAAA